MDIVSDFFDVYKTKDFLAGFTDFDRAMTDFEIWLAPGRHEQNHLKIKESLHQLAELVRERIGTPENAFKTRDSRAKKYFLFSRTSLNSFSKKS